MFSVDPGWVVHVAHGTVQVTLNLGLGGLCRGKVSTRPLATGCYWLWFIVGHPEGTMHLAWQLLLTAVVKRLLAIMMGNVSQGYTLIYK